MSIERTDRPAPAPRPDELRERPRRPEGRRSERSPGGGDRVEFSERAREIRRLQELAARLPDVREERVRAQRERLRLESPAVDRSPLARLLLRLGSRLV
jgi:hypothetical protein